MPVLSVGSEPILNQIARLATHHDVAKLAVARDELGYLELDPKGRLASIKTLRRSIKKMSAADARPAAYAALEAAFPVPYDALKAHIAKKAACGKVPDSVYREDATDLARPLSVTKALPALPQGWARLRGIDGCVDAPRSIFRSARYFNALVNGEMQGGRDADGAYMVDMTQDMLRLVVQWCTHERLAPLPSDKAEALRQVAEAKAMDDLTDYIDATEFATSTMRKVQPTDYRRLVQQELEFLLHRDERTSVFLKPASRKVCAHIFSALALLLEPALIVLTPKMHVQNELRLGDILFCKIQALADRKFKISPALEVARYEYEYRQAICETDAMHALMDAVSRLLDALDCSLLRWETSPERNTITIHYMVL